MACVHNINKMIMQFISFPLAFPSGEKTVRQKTFDNPACHFTTTTGYSDLSGLSVIVLLWYEEIERKILKKPLKKMFCLVVTMTFLKLWFEDWKCRLTVVPVFIPHLTCSYFFVSSTVKAQQGECSANGKPHWLQDIADMTAGCSGR